jgi:histidinol-phosphate aminotransferase
MAKAFDLTQWARPEMLALVPYTSARDTFTATEGKYTFLDANENPNPSEVNRYPDPNQLALKKEIAFLRGCTINQLLIGNGSDEILDLLLRAFCTPNKDNVILMPPTYGMYAVLANINGVGIKEVPLTSDFQLNTAQILAAVDPNTKAIFFCSPNNPSGNLFKSSDIEALLNGFDGLVVIDEAYIDFTDGPSWLTELDNYSNLVVTQTLSKAFGLAGLRLGIAIAQPNIIKLLHNIKPPYNINTLSQQQAIEALSDIEKVNKQIAELLSERNRVAAYLNKLDWVKTVFPSDANFLLMRVDDANKRYDALLAQKVVVRNRSTQTNCENTLRISIGTPAENNELMAACNTISL